MPPCSPVRVRGLLVIPLLIGLLLALVHCATATPATAAHEPVHAQASAQAAGGQGPWAERVPGPCGGSVSGALAEHCRPSPALQPDGPAQRAVAARGPASPRRPAVAPGDGDAPRAPGMRSRLASTGRWRI
ncbi:hypothetical protein [Streptomyces sp. URMC 129]|uniref:hypothetical protein n=1 Tax=Streptomyces sp. URMC 129 TaxID=3423407 RepID=UPI003F1DEE8B